MRWKTAALWLGLAARNRRVLVVDFCALVFAVYIGYALRLTLLLPYDYFQHMLRAAALFTCVICPSFYLGGVYRVYWPQASVPEYAKLVRSYIYGTALFLLAYHLIGGFIIPRSSLAVMIFSALVFVVGLRASWRLLELSAYSSNLQKDGRRALIIGAGEAGAFLARDLAKRQSELLPVGFIDDDSAKMGKAISELPVFGTSDRISDIVESQDIEIILIAIPSANGTQIRRYLDLAARLGVEVRVLPSLHELAGGGVEFSRLRPVELRDLLRREPVTLDRMEIDEVIGGRRILVTGAGGSIGSEICAQLLSHRPAAIFALGHGEQSIYNLIQKTQECFRPLLRPVIADIADYESMKHVFETHKPDMVFHAAAHKHVPLMEENVREALRVNALGTWLLCDLAGRYSVRRFVMISTDKAVHPTSVMGASKRIAERLVMQEQDRHPATQFITVRFGNVLGSRGSVVPLFESQIRKNLPVTVTDPKMTRYFMLIPEAVSLVLQASTMGRGGELYVLDMGEPVNIMEMAETLIRLHGKEPHRDVEIIITGKRPGEKLFEELFYDRSSVARTSHDKILLARQNREDSRLIEDVRSLMELQEPTAASVIELAEER